MDVGTTLRHAREQHGLSVEDLARRTKITIANLKAVEQNRRDDLPGDVYVRGFVRAYAQEVGLDPAGTARRYLEQFAPPPEEVVAPAAGSPGAAPPFEAAWPAGAPKARRGASYIMALVDGRHSVRDHWIAAAILVGVAVGYGLVFAHSWSANLFRHSSPAAGVTAAATPTRPASHTDIVATTGSEKAAAVDADVLRIEVRASGRCWVAATADGTRAAYALMQPGEHRTFDVQRDLALRVGDPAAFAFAINGSAGRPLGRAGQPVTVNITRENYREFLQP